MSDLQLIVEFLFLQLRNIAVLYTEYLILAVCFSIFVLRKVFDLIHKVKN